jgi:hypothetical protein
MTEAAALPFAYRHRAGLLSQFDFSAGVRRLSWAAGTLELGRNQRGHERLRGASFGVMCWNQEWALRTSEFARGSIAELIRGSETITKWQWADVSGKGGCRGGIDDDT